jgi:hypothetical protein
MALSYEFRRALKSRTRRSRRLEVLLFFLTMVWGLSYAGEPYRRSQLGERAFPFILAAGRIYMLWRWRRVVRVSSLDEWAMVEFGVELDRLTEAQQHDLLRRYRVGTYITNNFPDELQVAQEAQAHVQAYSFMRVLFPPLVVVYWLGWLWLPQGRLRAGWTDAPTVMIWIALLVLALPQMIQMWTEPDDIGEPRIAEEKDA